MNSTQWFYVVLAVICGVALWTTTDEVQQGLRAIAMLQCLTMIELHKNKP